MKIIAARDLQGTLESALACHHVPGASVAIWQCGELLTAAAGVTNATTGVALTPDTVMHIGSITKVLNATLVMQLVDEGRVELDSPVLRYLPDLRLKDQAALERMTVRMLLDHTSGIDGDWLPILDHDEETIGNAIRRFAQLGQLFVPGAEFSYCNAATVIAGYLSQRLTGRSWYRLVRERIFAPLGLQHAVTLPEEALLHRASVGHFLQRTPQPQLVRTSFAFLSLGLAPAGSTLMMSAQDLIGFARAHMSGGLAPNGARILSAQSARAMQERVIDNRGKRYTYTDGVGVGWMVSDEGLLHHSGGGPGIVSVLYAYPRHDFAVAILTNADHGFDLINDLLEPWLRELGTPRPLGRADVRVPSKPPVIEHDRYVGEFEDLVHRFRVARDGDRLTLSRQIRFPLYDNFPTVPTPAASLIPLGDDAFFLEPGDRDAAHSAETFERIYVFRNEDGGGRMCHLGNYLRLYKRVT